MSKKYGLTRLIAAGAIAAVALGACGSGSETPAASASGQEARANQLDITMNDYSFTADGEARPGPLTLNYSNEGSEIHHAILGKLDQGKDLADVQAFLNKGFDGEPPAWFADDPIDMELVSPGQTSGVVFDAQEGTYVLLCFMPTPEGEPHVGHGMVQTFEVSGSGETTQPVADADISLSESAVESSELAAGPSVVDVTNDGKAPAQFFVTAIEPGAELKDIDTWFEKGQKGPAPAQFFGGTNEIQPGSTSTFVLSLEPGTYTAMAAYEDGNKVKDVLGELTVSD